MEREGRVVPATLVTPVGVPSPPAWVALHGITRPGRSHPGLQRFTRAVAAAGVATIVPEVPEWRELLLRPDLTAATVTAGIAGLRETGIAVDRPVGVVGFSFGAPHAIATASHPELASEIGAVASFGGYADLEATLRFMMFGHHEWGGCTHRLLPDPYGRWIVAGNFLTHVPGFDEAGDVAAALLELGRISGDVGAYAWDPVYDPSIREMRARVAAPRRPLFDEFATESTSRRPDVDPEWPSRLAAAARSVVPSIDPVETLGEPQAPVTILHGFRDNLIPFSEAHRLGRVAGGADTTVTVTRLFGHSGQDELRLGEALRELPPFARTLGRLLYMV